MMGKDFDVAKNIKMTENLQCQLLESISALYRAMQDNQTKTQKAEILADMEITLFLLAGRMGISKQTLDQKAISNLKVGIIEEDRTEWKTSLLELLHQLEGKTGA